MNAMKEPAMKLTIGMMGSANDHESTSNKKTAYRLGEYLAEKDIILVTGACPGLPYECAKGAFKCSGTSIGISPALSHHEHVHKYHSPADAFDVIIYTGSGLMGREVTNIRSSDMVVIMGGQSGTLGEFAIAYDEGKLIGVIEGSGGITDRLPELVESLTKETGAIIIYEREPEKLIDRMVEYYRKIHFQRPSCFCDV